MKISPAWNNCMIQSKTEETVSAGTHHSQPVVKDEMLMIEKPKNSTSRMGTLFFLTLWTSFSTGAWLFTLYLWLNYQSIFAPDAPHALLIAFFPGFLPAIGQMLLMRYGLKKRSVASWIPVSLVGQLASAFSYYAFFQTAYSAESTAARVAALFVPAALFQAAWLYRRVKTPWLWVIGGLVSAFLFAFPLRTAYENQDMYYLMVGLAAAMQGLVSGSIMRHLWTQEREKNKRALTAQEIEALHAEELERLERLERMQDNLPAEEAASGGSRLSKAMAKLTGS
jgi:hypothetical protein